MKAVMGIDPGVKGGVAVLGEKGHLVWCAPFMPHYTYQNLDEIMGYGVHYLKLYGGNDAFLEKVNSLPRDGHVGAFTFGRVVGILAEAAIARGVQLHEVPAMIWQSRMECLSGGNKNVTKRKAQELFPDFEKTQGAKITHAIADALLIAAYGHRRLTQCS